MAKEGFDEYLNEINKAFLWEDVADGVGHDGGWENGGRLAGSG